MAQASRPLLALAAVAGALLAAAPPAPARAPSTSTAPSLDWLKEKLERDRQEDERAAKQVAPLQAKSHQFQIGAVPLDQWKDLADGIKDPRERAVLRDFATTAFIERNKKEEERRTLDEGLRRKFRKEVLAELLALMTTDDLKGQECIHRLLQAFLPRSGVEWKPNDPRSRRLKAHRDLQKIIRSL